MISRVIALLAVSSICFWIAYAGYTATVVDGITVYSLTTAFGNEDSRVADKLTVTLGSTFAIELVSNPTTGYMWIMPDYTVLTYLSTNTTDGEGLFIAPESDAIGAPGKQRFFFKAFLLGEQTIKLEYKRPWEDRPIFTYNVFVHVI